MSEEEPESLPEPMARVLGEYERHLSAERDLTAHTVRAYVGDVGGLLEHAARLGHTDAGTLDLRTLRSWLAKQQTLGKSRTTIARRATAARVFTAWLARTGRAATDAGASLGSPKKHASLPPVLRASRADGNGAPGAVIDDKLTIACGDGAVRLLNVQRAGKQPMNAEDFLRGNAVSAGARLS